MSFGLTGLGLAVVDQTTDQAADQGFEGGMKANNGLAHIAPGLDGRSTPTAAAPRGIGEADRLVSR